MKLKILIANDGYHAHYFIRLGLARVLSYIGHEVVMWQLDKKPVNDAFDEFNPHIFIGQTYNVDRVMYKAIADRPYMKVVMKASDWGPIQQIMDLKKFPVLTAREDEKDFILKLKNETGKPDYCEIHYHKKAIQATHGEWIRNGVSVVSALSGADVFEFTKGKYDARFASDLTFIGGYWPYKAEVLDDYLLRLCGRDNLNIKIFGNNRWPVPEYCGFIHEKFTRHALASAKICPNLHEPHSQKYGYDIVERPFKLLSNKCFVISDFVEGLADIIPKGIVYAEDSDHFEKLVYDYINREEDRKEIAEIGYKAVMAGHTYFHRVADMFNQLGLENEAEECMRKFGEFNARQ